MAASSDNWYDDSWGKLTGEMFDLITECLDVSSVVRLAACSKELCCQVASTMVLHHWDGPCLLMPNPSRLHYNDANTAHNMVFGLVPLDHPRRTTILPFMDNRFWVGMNGDWIIAIDLSGHWFLANLYTRRQIDLLDHPHMLRTPVHYVMTSNMVASFMRWTNGTVPCTAGIPHMTVSFQSIPYNTS
jgi:hypothetical protein